MAHKVSPLAPERFPDLPPVAGARFATANCGIRYKGRDDLMVAVLDPGTTIAGVTTRSKTCSAPVLWCREHLPKGTARALVVNSGNSNAFTGKAGRAFLDATVAAAAAVVGCAPEAVFAASTGVIGQPMSPDQIARHLPAVVPNAAPGNLGAAARAIMTTDTYPKGAVATATVGGRTVTITGIAKGSGMIAPDMATMLAFVFTDAAVAAPYLQDLVTRGTRRSFNAITVDGDTSTSDTLLVCATGKAGNAPLTQARDPGARAFAQALDAVLLDLALQIVKDGEGAQKLVTIDVTGAVSARSAHRIGMAIANSPLVKTAIAGEDANWGRIVMAVGKSGEPAERDLLKVAVGGVTIAAEGGAVEGYDETPVVAHMKGRDIKIHVDLGLGKGKARVWTCDLTHAYIDINGSYRS
jgi:glutamate N-acetyltransferase/amino-acid N-acetyltransferase